MTAKETLAQWATGNITSNVKHISHNLTELDTAELIRTIIGMSVVLSVPLQDMLPVIDYLKTRSDLVDSWTVLEGKAFARRGVELEKLLK